MAIRRKRKYWITAGVLVVLSGAGLSLVRNTSKSAPLNCGLHVTIASSPAECMSNLMVAASFDALSPKAKSAAVLQLEFNNRDVRSVGSRGFSYRVDADGQFRVVSTDKDLDRSMDLGYFPPDGKTTEDEGIRAFQNRIFELGKRARTAPKLKKRPTPNCDPNRLEAITGLAEEPLRSCLRSIFLLHNRREFNTATQALFAAAEKFRYADGKDGPLSFAYPGADDDDRSEVVKILRRIDKQAHDQGGLR